MNDVRRRLKTDDFLFYMMVFVLNNDGFCINFRKSL